MICMSRRRRRISPRTGREQIAAFEAHAAGCGLDQAKDEPPERALAGAGFADQAKRFAGMDVEGNVVNGADFAADLPPKGDSA